MNRRLWLLVALLAGCAHNPPKDKSTICPEYQDQSCLAGQDCAMDTARGCRVCQCTSVDTNGFTPTSDPNYIPQH